MFILKVSIDNTGNEYLLLFQDEATQPFPLEVQMRWEVSMLRGETISAPGMPDVEKDDVLKTDWAFLLWCKQEFDEVELVEGEYPELPGVPDGAIP